MGFRQLVVSLHKQRLSCIGGDGLYHIQTEPGERGRRNTTGNRVYADEIASQMLNNRCSQNRTGAGTGQNKDLLLFCAGIKPGDVLYKISAVGKIDIRDNVFVGYGAIILPGVTIGPNALVAAGAVVRRDVAPGDVVGGVPARSLGRVEDLVDKLKEQTAQLPWADLIAGREGSYDAAMEPELKRRRVEHFYGAQPD